MRIRRPDPAGDFEGALALVRPAHVSRLHPRPHVPPDVIDLDNGLLSEPALPAGVELRPFDPERDAHALHEALDEAFAEEWGCVRVSDGAPERVIPSVADAGRIESGTWERTV